VIVKTIKSIAALTMLIPAVWMIAGMILLAIIAE
jgi:hypothetical protein